MWSFQQIHDLFTEAAKKFSPRLLMMRMMMWKTDTLSDAFTAKVRVQGEKCCQSPPHLIVLLQDGVPMPPLCTDYNCHLGLIQSSAALRPHLPLRMSDRTAATYDRSNFTFTVHLWQFIERGSNVLSARLSTQLPWFTFPICLSQTALSWEWKEGWWPVNSTTLYLTMNSLHTYSQCVHIAYGMVTHISFNIGSCGF